MIFDGHGDILTHIQQELSLGIDIFKEYHLPKYLSADVMGSIFVNYTDPQNPAQKQQFEKITHLAIPYLTNSGYVNIVKEANDFKLGKLNIILGIEGAKPLRTIKDISHCYDLGYRHIGLTWNERNQFGCGASEIGGLTDLGEAAIKWCNEHGMIIDFAHLNYQSFIEASLITNKPILFSHGNAFALCPHPRNLDDDQLLLIKESNGVVGIAAIKPFLVKSGSATIDDMVTHILYIKNKIGINHVGLGLDFCHYLDNLEKNDVQGMEHLSSAVNLRERLSLAGLATEEIDAVMFKNMLRVVKSHLHGGE
ncbi:membrane dipeptidase [Mollicutes bacterium LVI A0039]|nr:membrane dipeptidase [Mollicutes bacterium LVI A0039]